MYLFHNDYNEMCHPEILKKMSQYRLVQMPGYGCDESCEKAAEVIRAVCDNKDISVHFLVGGTQTNLTVIAAALRPYQAVICAATGHISCHETGAIEATGHKVVTLPHWDGKITAEQIESAVISQINDETAEHNVQVKMVYISNSTEYGTTYNRTELQSISNVCKKYGLYLYMDGARLSYALEASDCDLTLADLSHLCDVFYIGGTKCGAMFGEAVVISNSVLAQDFRYMIKQRGGMLAKGWLLGLQFATLFENNLYFKIAAQANRHADQLRATFESHKISVLPGKSNQVFSILPNRLLDKLSENFTFMTDKAVDENHKLVRFCTSWATTDESMNALCKAIDSYFA